MLIMLSKELIEHLPKVGGSAGIAPRFRSCCR